MLGACFCTAGQCWGDSRQANSDRGVRDSDASQNPLRMLPAPSFCNVCPRAALRLEPRCDRKTCNRISSHLSKSMHMVSSRFVFLKLVSLSSTHGCCADSERTLLPCSASQARDLVRASVGEAFDERELALGFHWPPWYSVPWLHLHAIYPRSKMKRRYKYTPITFRSPLWVIARLDADGRRRHG
eukprot:677836-Pleurochrysis_carterae.AAC.5